MCAAPGECRPAPRLRKGRWRRRFGRRALEVSSERNGPKGGGTLVEPDAPSSSACLLANLQKNECPPLHLAVSEPLGYPFRLQVARRSPNPKVQVCGAAF